MSDAVRMQTWRVPIGVLLVGLLGAWHLSLLPIAPPATAVADLLFLLTSAGAGFLCLRAARRLGPAGRPWRWFAAGCLAWFGGQVVWTINDLFRGGNAFPSLADVGYLLFFPCFVVGTVGLIRAAAAGPPPYELVIDGALIALVAVTAGYETLMRPLLDHPAVDDSAWAAGLFWQVAAVPLFVLAGVALIWQAHAGRRRPLLALAAGFLAFAATNLVYGRLVATGAYRPGHALDLGWHVGFAGFAWAALLAAREPGQAVRRRHGIGARYLRWRALLTAGAAVVLTALAVSAATRPGADWFIVGAVVLAGLIFALRLGSAAFYADRLASATRHADERAMLLRVSQAATSSLELRPMLAEVARAALAIPGADACRIELCRPAADAFEVAAVAAPGWPGLDQVGVREPIGRRAAVRRARQAPGPLLLALPDPLMTDGERAELTRAGVAGLLLVPLLLGSDCLGQIHLFARQPDAFGDDAVRLAGDVAVQTALAIRNAQLLETARRQAEVQAVLYRVSQAVVASVEYRDVLREVARAGLGVAGIECCEIELWYRESDETEMVAQEYVPDWPVPSNVGARFPLADWPITREVMASGTPRAFGVEASFLSAVERDVFARAGTRSVLVVPLLIDGGCLGVLNLYARQANAFPASTVRLGQDLANQAAITIERARLHAALEERARTDGLTGLLNHRAILDALEVELGRQRRTGDPVALLMIDLNGFKAFNDTHGHLVGDRALRELADLLRRTVREVDHVGRYGGDEFLVVLAATDRAGAAVVAERLRARADRSGLPLDGVVLPLRLSIGLAATSAEAATAQELIAAADAAMYAAKRGPAPLPPLAASA